MSFNTSYGLFNDGTDPGSNADPDASTIGGNVETSAFDHWVITWCPTGQTLTNVPSGTFSPPLGTPGPIVPMTLVETVTPIGDFQAQIWRRTGSSIHGSTPVYFQWSHSHTLATPPIGAVDISDYVAVMGLSFSGAEAGYVYAYTALTGSSTPQDFPSYVLPSDLTLFDVGFAVVVDAPIADVDTAGVLTINGPVGSSPVGGGSVGRGTGLPSTDVIVGTGSESSAPIPTPGMGGDYTIDGYSVDGPTSTWVAAFLFAVAGYFVPVPEPETGWRVGRVGAGNNPW